MSHPTATAPDASPPSLWPPGTIVIQACYAGFGAGRPTAYAAAAVARGAQAAGGDALLFRATCLACGASRQQTVRGPTLPRAPGGALDAFAGEFADAHDAGACLPTLADPAALAGHVADALARHLGPDGAEGLRAAIEALAAADPREDAAGAGAWVLVAGPGGAAPAALAGDAALVAAGRQWDHPALAAHGAALHRAAAAAPGALAALTGPAGLDDAGRPTRRWWLLAPDQLLPFTTTYPSDAADPAHAPLVLTLDRDEDPWPAAGGDPAAEPSAETSAAAFPLARQSVWDAIAVAGLPERAAA